MAESQLSAALGQPVRIGSVHLSLFPSPTVSGTDIVVGAGAGGAGPSLDIHAIRLHPRLSTIFEHPVVIDRVELEGLALNAVRDAGGQWVVPLPAGGAPPAAANEAPAKARLDVAVVALKDGRLTIADARPDRLAARVTPIHGVDATVRRSGDVTRLDGLTAWVGRSKVAGDGTLDADGLRVSMRWTDLQAGDLPFVFDLVGTNPPPGLSIAGKNPLTLALRIDRTGQVSASGRLTADRAALGTLALASFHSPVAFANNRLTLAPMAFQAYSGTGAGRLAVNVAASPVSWALAATLQHVDIDRFLSENTTAKGKITGTGAIDARLSGTSRTPVGRTVAGTAAVSIANGTIRDFPLLAAIYSALKLGGGGDRDLHFQALSGTFNIAGERATTNDLLATSGEMTMAAAGTIGFDQALAMTGTVRFSPVRSQAFVHSIRELSSLQNADGEIEVPFSVAGTLSTARFSIDVASLMRRGLQNELKRRIGDKLRDLFKKK